MRLILLASVGLAVLAASAPGLVSRYLGQRDAARVVTEARNGPERGNSGGRRVEIEVSRDGHFYVDAEINFRPVRLMVDTGASAVALRQSDAAAVGIRFRPADFEQPVATANGTAFAASAELDQIAVHDIEVSGVRALILPDDQLSISLLGGSFLSRLTRYQVEDGTLMFEN